MKTRAKLNILHVYNLMRMNIFLHFLICMSKYQSAHICIVKICVQYLITYSLCEMKKFLMSISCSQSMPTAAAAVAAMAAAAQVWLIWWLGKCHAHINLIANRLYACICVCVQANKQLATIFLNINLIY